MTKNKEKLLVSFSGGETSAFMLWFILAHLSWKYEIIVVFANTGREEEATLEFVRDVSNHFNVEVIWVEAVVHKGQRKGSTHKIVTFETASRNGEPFEEVIKKYGIPNVDFLHCTRELKANPIRSYAKSVFGSDDYLTAIGIRADEADRIQKGKYLYPLIKQGIRKENVESFWKEMPFRLKLNATQQPKELRGYLGNCKKCFKKTITKLIQKNRDELNGLCENDDWLERMEEKYQAFVPETQKAGRQVPIRFNRKNMSAKEIKELAKLPDSEVKAFLKSKRIKPNLSNGCSESCEVF